VSCPTSAVAKSASAASPEVADRERQQRPGVIRPHVVARSVASRLLDDRRRRAMRGRGLIAPVALLVLLLPVLPFGCTVTTAPVPGARPVILATEATGRLIVSWTIARRNDRGVCDAGAATAVRIHIVTTAGADAGTYGEDCAAFSTSIRLDPESYAGTAVLVDALGRARTSTMTLQPFTILGGDVITTPIDFAVETFTSN
jgi:hypothetical protein